MNHFEVRLKMTAVTKIIRLDASINQPNVSSFPLKMLRMLKMSISFSKLKNHVMPKIETSNIISFFTAPQKLTYKRR